MTLETVTDFHNKLQDIMKTPKFNPAQFDNSFLKKSLVKSIQNNAIRNCKIVVDYTRKIVNSEENGVCTVVHTVNVDNLPTRVISANVVSKSFDILNYPIIFLNSDAVLTPWFYQLKYKVMCEPGEFDLLGGSQLEIFSTCDGESSDFYKSVKQDPLDKYILKNQSCFRCYTAEADHLANAVLKNLPELNGEKSKYRVVLQQNFENR